MRSLNERILDATRALLARRLRRLSGPMQCAGHRAAAEQMRSWAQLIDQDRMRPEDFDAVIDALSELEAVTRLEAVAR